jgi:ornithine decarboxylase
VVQRGFSLFGPTCDSADTMRGPFVLPADVAEGDWIEIGLLGAYGGCFRTAFNGFDRARMVEVCDAPVGQEAEDAVASTRLAA